MMQRTELVLSVCDYKRSLLALATLKTESCHDANFVGDTALCHNDSRHHVNSRFSVQLALRGVLEKENCDNIIDILKLTACCI